MKVLLKNAFKSYSRGQDKLIPASKTIKKAILALDNPKARISFKLEKIDCVDKVDIPSFVCKIDKLTKQSYGLTQEYMWGKGVNVPQAKASAIMELIERASCSSFLINKKKLKMNSYSKPGKSAIVT